MHPGILASSWVSPSLIFFGGNPSVVCYMLAIMLVSKHKKLPANI